MHIVPDLKRLEAKYREELVVIGVHSAKFSSEKESANIREAILRYDLEHAVVNDRDFAVWNAYGVNAWPTLVLIGPDGRLVGYASGEGHFEALDNAIAGLIKEFDGRKELNRKPLRLVLERDTRPASVLSFPAKIAADPAGKRLFVSDANHNRVVVLGIDGAVRDVIGDGTAGAADGAYAVARFFRPQGLALDAGSQKLYVADTNNHTIRVIDLAQRRVSTLVGSGRQATYPVHGGAGKAVDLSTPWDLVLVGRTLYVAMAGTHQLWSVDLDSLRAEPYAGGNREDLTDGPLATANLAQPSGITSDGKRLVFADSESSAIRTADLGGQGEVQTLIGTGLFDFGDVDGRYPAARLQHPLGVAVHDGAVWVADTYNHKIRRIDPKTRAIETVVGTGKRGMADGPGRSASLNEPGGLVFLGGRLFIADTNNHLIRIYDPATDRLSTLRLTGVDRLARPVASGFTGNSIRLEERAVKPGSGSLTIDLQLPAGTKLNAAAPFQVKAASDRPSAVAVPARRPSPPTTRITVPYTALAGSATVSVELAISFCSEGNEGLCYFRSLRVSVPLRVSAAGRSAVQAVVSL